MNKQMLTMQQSWIYINDKNQLNLTDIEK